MNDIFKYAIGAVVGAGATYLVMNQKNHTQVTKESLVQQIVAKYGNQIDVTIEQLRALSIDKLQGVLNGTYR